MRPPLIGEMTELGTFPRKVPVNIWTGSSDPVERTDTWKCQFAMVGVTVFPAFSSGMPFLSTAFEATSDMGLMPRRFVAERRH